jgi:hypothetical protein
MAKHWLSIEEDEMTEMKLNELLDDEELTEIFRERAETEAGRIFSETARDIMQKHAKTIAEREIKKVVSSTLTGEVVVDNGWGDKKVYKSLQDMFKVHLEKEIKGYQLQKAVEREVTNQVKALISAKTKQLAAKLVAELGR